MSNVLPLSSIVQSKIVVCALGGESEMLGAILDSGAAGLLELHAGKSLTPTNPIVAFQRYEKLKMLTANNGQILILHGRSLLALCKKKYFWGSNVETILVADGLMKLLVSPFIKRYQQHRLLDFQGRCAFQVGEKIRHYDVYAVPKRSANNRKVYAPNHLGGIEILQSLKSIDHILLRAFSRVEKGKSYKDLDILIHANSAPQLRHLFSRTVGTKAIDVYSVDGSGGFDYQSVPYILPRLAEAALASAYERPSGIMAPSPEYAYLTFLFHLLFHGKSRKIAHDASKIKPGMFSDKHWQDLLDLCREASLSVPQTLEDMEEALRDRNYFPGRDLLAFYAKNNEFVRKRYLEKDRLPAGLSTFFVRSFPEIPNQTSAVREVLCKEMSIVAEGDLTEDQQRTVMERVRGGNWYDRTLNANAPPVHWFVCHDPTPSPPKGKIRSRYPDLDNEKNARLKLELRRRLKDRRGLPVRYIHASDNSDEAMEHVLALELENSSEILSLVDPTRVSEKQR